jgi:DNA polymerase III delta prime subunit
MNWKYITQALEPQALSDIVFADDTHQQTIHRIASGVKPFPSSGKNGILLYGVPGTGKSALAMLLPQAMEASRGGGDAYERVFRVVSGQNGADMIKKIDAQAQLVSDASHQYFVLDEVDNLTAVAMTSLKSAMNNSNAIFILTTNNLSAIEVGIKDRCVLVPFNEAPAERWLPRAHQLLQLGGVTGVQEDDLLHVISTCKGSARKIIEALIDLVIAWRSQHGLPAIPP